MTFSKTLSHLLRNGEETREQHRDPSLRTRYYRKSKTDMMNTIDYLVKNKLRTWRILHTESEHGEIVATKKHPLGTSDVIITVFAVSPLRSAIDIATTRRGRLGDLGTSYRAIMEFFDALKREVPPESP